MAVFTKEMLETQQALTLGDTVRNTAGVSASQINSVIYSNLTIRGLAANNFTNYRLNGVLPIVNLVDMPLENKSRVEVLKDASGLPTQESFRRPRAIDIERASLGRHRLRFAGARVATSHQALGIGGILTAR